MNTTDSDRLCPCGSRIGFNFCHGAALRGTLDLVGTSELKANVGRTPFMGFPKSHQLFHYQRRFEKDDPRSALPIKGSPGKYVVTFILNRPGYNLTPENDISAVEQSQGDSHLAITRPAFVPPWDPDLTDIRISIQGRGSELAFIGYPNSKGFLGKLISDPFQADDKKDAEAIAYVALSSLLSNISLHLDIPLEIEHREVRELANDSLQVSFVRPHIEAPFWMRHAGNIPTELNSYAALYREALNTNSQVYEFLCLYKLVESLRARRVRLRRAAKGSRIPYIAPQEVLPATEENIRLWLRSIFYVQREHDLATVRCAVPQEMRGCSADEVVKHVLKPLRDNIAHAILDAENELPVSPNNMLHIQQVTHCLPVIKCIARQMLKTDFPDHFGDCAN